MSVSVAAPRHTSARVAAILDTHRPVTDHLPSTTFSPIRSRTFVHLTAAYTMNEFGNWIGDVALAILVYDRTGSALWTAGLFLSLRFLPAGLAPLLTTRLQVLRPRRVLPAVHLIEGAILLAIALLSPGISLVLVLILATMDGVLAIAGTALTRGCTAALLLPHDALRRGNAILNLGFAAGGALGPALAGVLVAAMGPGSALAADSATYLVAALILAAAPGLRLDSDRTRDSLGRLRDGIGEAWQRVGVRRLLIAQAVVLIFFTAAVPVEVVFAKQTLNAGDAGYGALMASWGVGMILGGVAFARAGRVRLLVVIALSTALVGVGYGGIALAPDLAVACAFSMIGGIGNGVQWISVSTAVQNAISRVSQSAVSALLGSINQVMPALGFLLGGVVASVATPRAAYAVGAAGVFLVLLIGALRPPLELDGAAAGPVTLDNFTGSGVAS